MRKKVEIIDHSYTYLFIGGGTWWVPLLSLLSLLFKSWIYRHSIHVFVKELGEYLNILPIAKTTSLLNYNT